MDDKSSFAAPKKIVILTPVYNDWVSFAHLLQEINAQGARLANSTIHVIAVDDGSTSPPLASADYKNLPFIKQINILHLARNLGHQKAIALGIAYINSNIQCNAVIVMDADGEDQPSDIAKLLQESQTHPNHIIFAHRARRSEGLLFTIFYLLYRSLFRMLTGTKITFGNYSLIPSALLYRVAYLPEIWNHFAAGIIHAHIPWVTIPTQRGSRYAGKSSMNFVALVIHGLSAISVYIEILTVRLMLGAFFIIAMSLISFLILLYIKYLTLLAIPGWATNVAIGISIIMFQAVLLLTLLAMLTLNHRSNKLFIPAKDYQDYILEFERIL